MYSDIVFVLKLCTFSFVNDACSDADLYLLKTLSCKLVTSLTLIEFLVKHIIVLYWWLKQLNFLSV